MSVENIQVADHVDTTSEDRICVWHEGDEYWNASCGYEFVLNEGTPAESHMNFCPHCGGVLQEEILH
jgi:hypothetical protein